MPVCFQLYRKSDMAAGPVSFQLIDDEMREHFKAEPDPEFYYECWYDTIGSGLALGHSFEELKEFFPDKIEIIDWMAKRFTADSSWREHKH